MKPAEIDIKWQSPSQGRLVANYGFCLINVFLATLITRWIQPFLGESISPLFFAAVVLSTWLGGLGPGLLATLLAGWASAYFFVNTQRLFDIDDGIRLAVFLMVSLLMSSLMSLRRRAELALQRANNALEERVKLRTTELECSNSRARESEQKFRLLVDGVEDYAMITLDLQGHVSSWNPGAARIYGFTAEEVMGKSFACLFPAHERVRGRPAQQIISAAAKGHREEEGWRVRRDGTQFLASVLTTALHDAGAQPCGYAQITRDITALRALEREVLDTSEQERRRIGHDLHDGLGQELTGIAFLCQNLAQKLRLRDIPEGQEAERLEQLTIKAIEQVRELARGFSPVELGPDGLQAALRELAAKLRNVFRLDVKVRCDPQATIHDDDAALHLFRIAQEALNNVVRHSRATQVKIDLTRGKEDVVLNIEDNGVGISVERSGGMGLRVMAYRAHIIGASLSVRAGAGNGTCVECAYPIANAPPVFPTNESPPPSAAGESVCDDEKQKADAHG